MSYIPEYHENYYRVEGTAYNQGKIGIGTINPVQLLHVSGGNFRVDGTGYINGDLNVTGNLNVYGIAAQFATQQVIAEDSNIELNVLTGDPIGGSGLYTTLPLTDDAGADSGGITLKSTTVDSARGVRDKAFIYRTSSPTSGWISNLRFAVSGNYGKDSLVIVDPADTTDNRNLGLSISGSNTTNAVNLYRASGNALATDDLFAITIDSGKNTLHLNNTNANVGMTIGHDTVLYRSGANVLSTDDRLGITLNDGKRTFHLTNDIVNVGMTIGNDPTRVELYRASGDVLATDDVILSTVASGKNTISLTDTTTNVGLTLGHDTNLYRSAANTLRTDDSFIVDGATCSINSTTITLGDANTDTLDINAGPVNLRNSTTPADALVFGVTNSANLYGNSDTLFTDDSVNIAQNLTVSGNLNVSGTMILGDLAADTLTINAGPVNLPNATAAADALVFGVTNSANLYGNSDTLFTDDSVNIAQNLTVSGSLNVSGGMIFGDLAADTLTINAGPLNLPNATAAADALVFGSANSANLYRSANDTLKTDDSFIIETNLSVNGNSTLGNSYTDQILITGKLLIGTLTYSGAGVTTQVNSIPITTDKVIVTGAGILNGSLNLPAAVS